MPVTQFIHGLLMRALRLDHRPDALPCPCADFLIPGQIIIIRLIRKNAPQGRTILRRIENDIGKTLSHALCCPDQPLGHVHVAAAAYLVQVIMHVADQLIDAVVVEMVGPVDHAVIHRDTLLRF